MNQKNEKITINLFGTSIKIQSNEDPQYVQELIHLIESKSELINTSVKLQDPLKISILTSLLIADEYMTLQNKVNNNSHEMNFEKTQLEKEVEEITSRLINQIDQLIVDDYF
jgi:cell division protein ZapA (FtsZ GTPase activity inhibitor)